MSENQDYIVLNGYKETLETSLDPLILSKNLVTLVLKLKGENFIDEKLIDYKNLIQNDLYKNDLNNLASMLNGVNLDYLVDNVHDEARVDTNLLVFFINIYNSLTIHSICYLHEKNLVSNSSMLGLLEGKFWSKMAYQIGSYVFSLDDIEHGILRCNRMHPSKKTTCFTQNDPRIKYCVRKFDPRIHFALNCGAKGCPPIAFFTVENLDRGLKLACEAFCTNETQINLSEKKIVVSRLFLWYGSDFADGTDEGLIDYVSSNFIPNDEISQQFNQLKSASAKIKVQFSDYNWEINQKI